MHPTLKNILAINVDGLCRMNLGNLSLPQHAERLNKIQTDVKALGETFGDGFPPGNQPEAQRLFGQEALQRAVSELGGLSGRSSADAQQYPNQLENSIGAVQSSLTIFLSWCTLFSVNPAYEHLMQKQSAAEQALQKDYDAAQALLTQTKKDLEEQTKTLQAMLDNARNEVQKVEVGNLEKVYSASVTAHRDYSFRWLIGMFGAAVLLVVLAFCLFRLDWNKTFPPGQEMNHWHATLLFGLILIPVLALLGVLNLCAKRAAAHSHLATVYEHKASIAKASLWMSNVEKDDKLRAEWMRTIVGGLVTFESSGFLTKDSGSGTPQPIAMQVIREAADVAKGGSPAGS